MPALGLPVTGFQALILCGPGASLNTFTAVPEEFPKALVPVANRPMVWYPLDWCYRLGITSITLITPPASQSALEAALSRDPHLTSLPHPSPTVVAPNDLLLTTGTAELLRLPEVQSCIKSDFVILPCDLITDLPGQSLLEVWMMTQASLDGTSDGSKLLPGSSSLLGLGGERGGRRGGIGVWYPIPPDGDGKTNDDLADFLVTAPLSGDEDRVMRGSPASSLTPRASLQKVVYTMPMDSLRDILDEKKAFFLRYPLLKKHGRVKMLTTYRDAHIYFFPYWVKEMARRNERFQSISEDLVGWWAKAGWQNGLPEKLQIQDLFSYEKDPENKNGSHASDHIEEEIDVMSMSTTKSTRDVSTKASRFKSLSMGTQPSFNPRLAEVPNESLASHNISTPPLSSASPLLAEKPTIPSILGYLNPSNTSAPLIRRVDTSSALLSLSLYLAKLESIIDLNLQLPTPISPSSGTLHPPLAHQNKIAYPAGIAPRCTVTKADCLLAENVTVEEKCSIRESVIGANCHIATGARLTKCLLMDGVVIGERCQLVGCIIGRRSKIGRDSVMKDCEVQHGNVIPEETDAKNEKFMIFEGLEDDMDAQHSGMGTVDGEDED
ncbi:hypothetical protein FQN57_000157 [Myotisia sp. PD_48]|nr:hypothetical protein FQN57_000157 [Myotisia sp. PD_48]